MKYLWKKKDEIIKYLCVNNCHRAFQKLFSQRNTNKETAIPNNPNLPAEESLVLLNHGKCLDKKNRAMKHLNNRSTETNNPQNT